MTTDKRQNGTRSMRRTVVTVLCFLWMGFIFYMSARPSDLSTNDSYSVGMLIGRTFVSGFSARPFAEQLAFVGRIDHILRKTAHFLEYFILFRLLYSGPVGLLEDKGKGPFLRTSVFSSGKNAAAKRAARAFACAAAAAIAGVLYAASDEIHQLFVPGRAGRFGDIMIDSAGVLTAAALTVLAAYLRARRSRREE